MIGNLTDIIMENWKMIPIIGLIAAGVYGGVESFYGSYKLMKDYSNMKPLLDIVKGGAIMGASGIAIPIWARLSTYL